MRLAVFEHVVDLRRVEELRGIEHRNGAVWIGASTTQATVERDAEVARLVPLLARAVPLIGHFQIRNRGTIGGSLAHADPASELPAVALALDAEFEAVSVRGRRTIPAAEFFTGTWSTALDDDEILATHRVPDLDRPVRLRRRGGRAAPRRLRHRRRRRRVEVDGDGLVERCAIGLFGMGSTPVRATAAEQSVVGAAASDVDPRRSAGSAVDDLASRPVRPPRFRRLPPARRRDRWSPARGASAIEEALRD